MALVRLALKNALQQRVVPPSLSSLVLSQNLSERSVSATQNQSWGSQLLKRVSTTTDKAQEYQPEAEGGKSSDKREVSVSEGSKKNKLFPRKKRMGGLWRRNNDPNFVPALHELFPSGLGNAIVQATEQMNRLLENLAPSRFLSRFKERDDHYVLRFDMPGLPKEDLKIKVVDNILIIEGEHKGEEEEESDDEHLSSGYVYYNTSLVLPEDAKTEDIKAELKDGVLWITIPKSEDKKKDVKEIQVQ